MKIQTLQRTAKRLAKALGGKYVSICIEFNVWKENKIPAEIKYSFYIEHEDHYYEKTAQGLNMAMNARIRKESQNLVDEGIEDNLE